MLNNSLYTKLLQGSGWALSIKLVSSASTFVISMLLARLLEPGSLGLYFLAFSLATTLSLITQWGLPRAIVREIARSLANDKPVKAAETIRGSVLVVLIVGATVAGLMASPAGGKILGLLSAGAQDRLLAGLVGGWAFMLAMQAVVSESYRGFHDIRSASIYAGALAALTGLSFYSVTWIKGYDLDVHRAVLIAILALVVSVSVGGVSLYTRLPKTPWSRALSENPTFFRLGGPFLLTNLLLFVALELHLWLLGYFWHEEEVAQYGAAYRLVMLLALPLTVVNSVLPSYIAHLHERAELKRLEEMLRGIATLAGLLALGILVFLVVAGRWVLEIVYGSSYIDAYLPLLILAIGQCINVLTGSPGQVLCMTGGETYVPRAAGTANMIGVLVSVTTIPEMGALGAAIGYAVSISLSNILMVYYVRRLTGITVFAGIDVIRQLLDRVRLYLELQ